MASLKNLFSFLLASYPLLASAQCGGYDWFPDSSHNPAYCGINYDDGSYLESGLIPVDSGCPGTFGLTYYATAFYTDINNVVRTVSNVNTVTTSNPTTTVPFFYNVPYSSILDGSELSINYVFTNGRTVTNLPPVTIYNSARFIKYTDTTSVVSTTVEVTRDSTSTIPSTATVTATNTASVTVTSATATETAGTQTVTHTVTITPRPRTIRKERIIIRTTTAQCIPSRYRRRDAAGKLDRRVPVTTTSSHVYAFVTCAGSPPTTTTVTTSTVLQTSTATNTFTNTVFTTVIAGTSTSTVTETDTVSATATVTITPPPVTKTAHTVAKRQTVTSTHTITIWEVKYHKKRLCTPPPPPPYHGSHGSCIKPSPFGHGHH